MKRLLFIYNPKAGKGEVPAEVASILDVFAKLGYLTTVWPTQKAGEATEMARTLAKRHHIVVCSGGDGTLSEVVTGLMAVEQPPRLAYLPAGTTNDFSRNLNLPKGLVPAAWMVERGVDYPCDIGSFNERYFTYVAAFGAFTDVAYDTPQPFKNTFGRLAYLVEGASRLDSLLTTYSMTVQYDDQPAFTGEYVYGMVSNTISVGGFKTFSPGKISMVDGLFEVVLVRVPKSPTQWHEAILAVAHQSYWETDSLTAFQCKRMTITTHEEVSWTLDGEYGGCPQKVEIENHQTALTLLAGPGFTGRPYTEDEPYQMGGKTHIIE